MYKLLILNFILILINIGVLFLINKKCKSEKSKYITLLILSMLTVVCHYSSLVYHLFTPLTPMGFLKSNPNLILPIYPCNVVMWLALVLGILKNKKTKFSLFLIDYVFWFGIVSALVGMFVNIDFINNPTLLDYDVTKGVLAHNFMLLNALALPALGFIKIRLEKNIIHIIISVIMMFIIGSYCNLLLEVIGGSDLANHVNSMFLIHSPFEGIPFLKYPLISIIAIFIYFNVFFIIELIIYKNKDRWYYRIFKKHK